MVRSILPTARAAAVLGVAALATLSCSRESPAPRAEPATAPDATADAGDTSAPRPAHEVVFEPEGGEPARVDVEIANTPATIERGLMYREHLGSDQGMLFIFPDEAPRTFWMKNTLIPLDMIFISADRMVAGIVENAEPLTTSPRRIEAPSRYVVEVNAGWARAHEIEAGTTVRFVGVD